MEKGYIERPKEKKIKVGTKKLYLIIYLFIYLFIREIEKEWKHTMQIHFINDNK